VQMFINAESSKCRHYKYRDFIFSVNLKRIILLLQKNAVLMCLCQISFKSCISRISF